MDAVLPYPDPPFRYWVRYRRCIVTREQPVRLYLGVGEPGRQADIHGPDEFAPQYDCGKPADVIRDAHQYGPNCWYIQHLVDVLHDAIRLNRTEDVTRALTIIDDAKQLPTIVKVLAVVYIEQYAYERIDSDNRDNRSRGVWLASYLAAIDVVGEELSAWVCETFGNEYALELTRYTVLDMAAYWEVDFHDASWRVWLRRPNTVI